MSRCRLLNLKTITERRSLYIVVRTETVKKMMKESMATPLA